MACIENAENEMKMRKEGECNVLLRMQERTGINQ